MVCFWAILFLSGNTIVVHAELMYRYLSTMEIVNVFVTRLLISGNFVAVHVGNYCIRSKHRDTWLSFLPRFATTINSCTYRRS